MIDYETANAQELINDCFHRAAVILEGNDRDIGEQYLNWALMHCIDELTHARDRLKKGETYVREHRRANRQFNQSK